MLQKVRDKVKGTEFEERIKLHKCEENKIGVSDHVDFVLHGPRSSEQGKVF